MLQRQIKLQNCLKHIAVGLIHIYRYFLSPWLGNQCRFYPSCSYYSEEAINQHGFFKGCYLTLIRLGKCHPWHPGGIDAVPQNNNCSPTHSHTIDGSK